MKQYLIIDWNGTQASKSTRDKLVSLLIENNHVNGPVSVTCLNERDLVKHAVCNIRPINDSSKGLADIIETAKKLNNIVGFSVDLHKNNLTDYRNILFRKMVQSKNLTEINDIKHCIVKLCNIDDMDISTISALVQQGFTADVLRELSGIESKFHIKITEEDV